MKLQDQIAVWLQFSRKERTGIAIILSICMLTWILPVCFAEEDLEVSRFELTAVEIDQAIRILDSSNQFKRGAFRTDTMLFPKWKKSNSAEQPSRLPVVALDINQADSLDLEQLPGIGVKLSSRIIRYRQRLGGFVSISQLSEVYGITDSLLMMLAGRLKVQQGFQPEQISINRAEYKELRKLPYLDHQATKAILAYRQAHGAFSNIEDLGSVMLLDKEVLHQIKPYITFRD